jgi:hypothetical protein
MEEFKVNKTRESRKMAKEMKKQHQSQNPPIDLKPSVVIQQTTTTTTTTIVEETIIPKEESSNGELDIKCMIKYWILVFILFFL